MKINHRTQNLFEKIEGYPEVPHLPLEAFNFNERLDNLNLFEKLIFKSFFYISGFISFHKHLPKNFEQLSRTVDLKSSALFAPVISATLTLKDDVRELTILERAAALILSVKSLHQDIKTAKLPADEYNGQALEMGQYPNLFSTCQIILEKHATIFKSKSTSQITVIAQGCFYLLHLGNTNNKVGMNETLSTLELIVQDAKQSSLDTNYNSPGIITCANNPTQLRSFNKLIRIENNKFALESIKHSLFTLCLDLDSYPSTYEETAKITHTENLSNRWFHSSLQIVVFGNAKAGVIVNFSTYISGNNMMRAAAELQKRASSINNNKLNESDDIQQLNFTKLNWNVDPIFIRKAEAVVRKIKDNQESIYTIENIGKSDFDKYNVKAIPAFIIALQLTADTFIDGHPRITQFLTMSKYRCMDLLTTVITTPKVTEFVDFVKCDNYDDSQALNLFHTAIKSQIEKIREERKHFPLHEQISLFIASRKGGIKIYVSILNIIRMILLSTTGFLGSKRREIIVSHPSIYDEVPILGRPGIKIPYAKYFGIHYQIMDKKIVVTMMPGLNWKIPNSEFIAELERDLGKIKGLLNKMRS